MFDKDKELQKIYTLKDISDDTEKAKISIMYDDAIEEVLIYTNRTVMLPNMYSVVRELVMYRYDASQNPVGIASESEGDVSISYRDMSTSSAIPSNIKVKLNRFYRNKMCMWGDPENEN